MSESLLNVEIGKLCLLIIHQSFSPIYHFDDSRSVLQNSNSLHAAGLNVISLISPCIHSFRLQSVKSQNDWTLQVASSFSSKPSFAMSSNAYETIMIIFLVSKKSNYASRGIFTFVFVNSITIKGNFIF
jgi:hypothetical protein